MKNLLTILIPFLLLSACKTERVIEPLPDASFTYKVDEKNAVLFYLRLTNVESYTIQFDDGTAASDTLTGTAPTKEITVVHDYKTNGQFTVALIVRNKKKTAQQQTTLEASKIIIPDFSYELLENGKIKLRNLSQNAIKYEWQIIHPTAGNGFPFHISTQKDLELTLDIAGNYEVSLEARRGQFNTSRKIRTIPVTSARQHIGFSGSYNGTYIEGPVENNQLACKYGFSSDADKDILFQSIYTLPLAGADSLKAPDNLYTVFYPLSVRKPYTQASQPERYNALKKYLTTSPDILEVTEENLDPALYNNNARYYPKAFWIKYRIAGKLLNGTLKTRVVVEAPY